MSKNEIKDEELIVVSAGAGIGGGTKKKDELSEEQLSSVSGGGKNGVGWCPRCGKHTFDNWNKRCDDCGYSKR